MAPRNDTNLASPITRGKNAERIPALGLVEPPPIVVESPHFSGSLATLFACVRERKVDLLAVPLAPICEAYFVYLLKMAANEAEASAGQERYPFLDEAAAALAALSYLLERKAWLLLPSPDPEPEVEDPSELLSPTAHEYQVAIESLRLWQEAREQVFFRPQEAAPDAYELPFTLGNVSVNDLARALERVLRKASPEPVEPLNKPRRSLSDQMRIVLTALSHDWTSLEDLIEPPFTRSEVVYWFLALLELIRLAQASVRLQAGEVQFARPK